MTPPRVEVPAAFGPFLRAQRERAGLSIPVLANKTSALERTIRAWEAGEATPTRSDWHKLGKQLRVMRTVRPSEWGWTNDPLPAPAVPAPTSKDVTAQSPKRKTFGECLREVREADGTTPTDLADFMGVTGPAVRAWEDGAANPVEEHYLMLVVLYEELKLCPEPDWRPIAPPDGGKGTTKGPRTLLTHQAAQGPASTKPAGVDITPKPSKPVTPAVVEKAHAPVTLPLGGLPVPMAGTVPAPPPPAQPGVVRFCCLDAL